MEAYHPSSDTISISKDTFGYEPVQHLAKQLFSLPERCEFIQISTPLDPRGYLDLYGEDPEKEYQLGDEKKSFTYHALACFFDHISFIIDEDIDCILTPKENGIQLIIISEGDAESSIEKLIKTQDDLIAAVSAFISASKSGKEADEE